MCGGVEDIHRERAHVSRIPNSYKDRAGCGLGSPIAFRDGERQGVSIGASRRFPDPRERGRDKRLRKLTNTVIIFRTVVGAGGCVYVS
jgi:hypothetical protein